VGRSRGRPAGRRPGADCAERAERLRRPGAEVVFVTGDLASYGVVKVLEGRMGDTYPDLAWEPKAAFTALADHYRR
jgi:hypothetical protein